MRIKLKQILENERSQVNFCDIEIFNVFKRDIDSVKESDNRKLILLTSYLDRKYDIQLYI